MRRTKEIIEGRKTEAEEEWAENTTKQGRTQQRRKGEEKTRKIWRKEREISAKKASKHTVYVLYFFFNVMTSLALIVCVIYIHILSLTFILHLLKIFIVNKQTTPHLDSIKINVRE